MNGRRAFNQIRDLVFAAACRDPRCVHVSHRLWLPCWRARIYDGYCPRHNRTCFSHCTEEARR